MKCLRSLALAAVAAAGFVAVALVGQAPPPLGGRMADAAGKFLASLDPEQKKKAALPFDGEARLKWFFTPQQTKDKQPTRVGARLEEMTAGQKQAALALLRTGLSDRGYEQATTIMSLEGLLAELEGPKGSIVRNPGWYFVSVFGEPTNTGSWGWRIEGHHLSVNYTLDKGQIVSATPLLLAANPADVKSGAKKGLRTLPEIEDRARELIKSLTPDQDKVAKQAKHFPEIREGNPKAGVGEPVGITADRLTDDQRKTLGALLRAYTDRMPAELAATEQKRADGTPLNQLHFAYSGSPEPGQGYTYRVQGPAFVVEFLNVQADSAKNPANHIHSAWRRLPADLGLSE
jgi:hypothetical protein